VGLRADLDVLENGCLARPTIHTPARPARILVAGMVRRVLRMPLYVFTQRSLEKLSRKTVFVSQYLFPQLHYNETVVHKYMTLFLRVAVHSCHLEGGEVKPHYFIGVQIKS